MSVSVTVVLTFDWSLVLQLYKFSVQGEISVVICTLFTSSTKVKMTVKELLALFNISLADVTILVWTIQPYVLSLLKAVCCEVFKLSQGCKFGDCCYFKTVWGYQAKAISIFSISSKMDPFAIPG